MDKTINALVEETDKYLLEKKLELGKKRAEELGLECFGGFDMKFYSADDIHKLLSEGVELFGQCHGTHRNSSWTTDEKPSKQEWGLSHTHTSLAIGIRPITPPSEERQIIQAIVNLWEHSINGSSVPLIEAIKMARAWLKEQKF